MVNAAFRLSPVDLAYLHTISSDVEGEVAWRDSHTTVDAQLIPERVASVQNKSIQSFPLKLRHADTYIASRIALVG
jgi:ubiquinone biosynthesis monooxygenase Coq6